MRGLQRLGALSLALSVAGGMAQADPCSLNWHSTIPVLMRGGDATVPAEIDGQIVGMAIDTGAADSMVTSQAAAQLGLRPIKDYPRSAVVSGVKGAAYYEVDLIHSLVLGGVTYRNIAILQSPLGGQAKPSEEPVAGLIGADMLAHYDVALDEPAGLLKLYTAPSGCGPISPDGQHRWTAVPFTLGDGDKILIDVMVNGRKLQAMLDTGAEETLLQASAANRVGLTTDGTTTPVDGIGEDRVTGTVQRAASLAVGEVTLKDVPLLVAPQSRELLDGADMLLGASLLTKVPVLISYRSRTLWLRTPDTKS